LTFQKSKIKNQKSKIKNQKSKIKNQKSKIKNQESKFFSAVGTWRKLFQKPNQKSKTSTYPRILHFPHKGVEDVGRDLRWLVNTRSLWGN
jgi:hypothetical protein